MATSVRSSIGPSADVETMAGQGDFISVYTVAGNCVALVSPASCQCIANLKDLLWVELGIPTFRQRLLLDSLELQGEDQLEALPKPRHLTLVLLSFRHSLGVELLNAAEEGDAHETQRLIDCFADPNVTDVEGWTALHMSSLNGHTEAVQTLLQAHADSNITATDGGAPMHMAAWSGHIDILRILCNAGADKDLAQHNGWTPLHIACRNGHTEIVQLLCASGVDVKKAVAAGWTPVQIAWWSRNQDILRILELNQQEVRPPTRLQMAKALVHSTINYLRSACSHRRRPSQFTRHL